MTERRCTNCHDPVGDDWHADPDDLDAELCADCCRVCAAEDAAMTAGPPASIDAAHLDRQRAFSLATFGPGDRAAGVLSHIRLELDEIEEALEFGEDPLPEWVDVVILALDGAWRSGAEPQAIIDAIVAKQTKNEARVWPDWRTADPDRAIEHDRVAEALGAADAVDVGGNPPAVLPRVANREAPGANTPCPICNDDGAVHDMAGNLLGPCDCAADR